MRILHLHLLLWGAGSVSLIAWRAVTYAGSQGVVSNHEPLMHKTIKASVRRDDCSDCRRSSAIASRVKLLVNRGSHVPDQDQKRGLDGPCSAGLLGRLKFVLYLRYETFAIFVSPFV